MVMKSAKCGAVLRGLLMPFRCLCLELCRLLGYKTELAHIARTTVLNTVITKFGYEREKEIDSRKRK